MVKPPWVSHFLGRVLHPGVHSGCPRRGPVSLGRIAGDPLERVAESAFRRVSKRAREIGNGNRFFAKSPLSKTHPPLRQISERGNTGDLFEGLGEGGPRHGGGFCQLLELPCSAWIAMHQAQRGGEPFVRDRAKPS